MTDLANRKTEVSVCGDFVGTAELEETTLPLVYTVGEEQIVIHYRQDALTAWAVDAAGNLLPGVLAYEFVWLNFNPGSEIYKSKGNHLKERLR